MRKLLRIVLITLGVILLILILTPVVFKSRIEATVKEKVNEQIHARVDWTGFSLSFFRGFPQLSISLHQLSVVGLEPFEGDTLAGLERFELRVNPFSALRRNLEVKSILIDRPLIQGIVLEDGSANWDIAPAEEGEEVPEDTTDFGSSMGVSLKRVAIRQGRIYYSDQASSMDASLEGLNLELKGDLSAAQSEIFLSTGVDRMNLKMGGIRYLRDAVLQLELQAAADLVENRYTLEKNLISLNGLELGAEGDVLLEEGGSMVMDLTLFSRETSFKTLLSLVPAVYLQDFESVKTSGNLQLDARINGIMNDSVFPDAQLTLLVQDGYFSYPDLPKDVSDVQISLNVDYRGADMDASKVQLDNLHFQLGGNPFDLNMLVDHPQSDMHVAGLARGVIDFSTLKDVVPMEDVNLEGRLETDLRWDTKLSYIEQENYEQVDLEGILRMEGLNLQSPELPVPVSIRNLDMQFNPRRVELSSLDAYLGSSDLHLTGYLQNFIPYVFAGQTLLGSLQVSSGLLDASEFLVSEGDQSPAPAAEQDSIVPVRPDSLARPPSAKIPENMDLALSLDVQRMTYEDIVVENLEGSMRVMGGVAGLENLRMEVIEGVVNTRGWIDTRGDFPEADVTLDMEGVDIPTAYKTFVSVEKLMPMAKYCRGKANITMAYHSLLDQSFAPLYESIDASGRVRTRGLQFYNLNEFVPLSEVLKNEKFSNMAPDEVNVGFTMREGRIILDPFDMNVEDSRITVSGSHGIDLTMDYKLDMRIAKSDLGTGANELMQGLTALAAGAGIQVPASDYLNVVARITGTFNHPRVSTDLSGNLLSSGEKAITAVEERITREVEQVESEVREDASAEAEKIISDAEAEAARLVEEARKAGEALVQEAEKQGDQLIKDAGSNPLKQVAARTAASELKKQAEQKSEKLVSEAEGKAADLVRKAREEAGRI